jgi:DUF4097 and DUF4098 domain-containing protein YvlB
MPRPLALACILSLSACHVPFGQDLRVDGVRLPEHHEEVHSLEAWPAEGLAIAAHRGDIRVESGSGPTTITVTVHERSPGEAHAHLEAGRLVARATNGATCALGNVVVRTAGPVRGLRASTGMGDVELRGVRVDGRIELETGKGDVVVHGAGEPESIAMGTGMGDVEAAHLRCASLVAETGMGSVRIEELEAIEAVLSSGMGDVTVVRARGTRVKAETGLGDVLLRESHFDTRELESGLGSVRQR